MYCTTAFTFFWGQPAYERNVIKVYCIARDEGWDADWLADLKPFPKCWHGSVTLFQVQGDFKKTFSNKIYVFNFYSAKLCAHWRSGILKVRPGWGEQNLCFYKIPAHIFKFLPWVITQMHFAPFGCIHLREAIFKRIYGLCAVREVRDGGG